MKKVLLFAFVLGCTFSLNSYSEEEIYEAEDLSYETDGILHEMFLSCVATKTECQALAHHRGYAFVKVVSDRDRCPTRPKTKACIVQH